VAAFQGATLLEDLAGRDFSINAMAVDLTHSPFSLIDPTGGLADLRAGRLRAASPQSLYRDAVRALRAVRMRARFGFEIEPDTVDLIRDAAPRLAGVSAERVRDELVKILGLPGAAESLRTLAALRLLDVVLPELTPLKGLPQPHRTVDGFDHTLQVVADLEQLLPPGGRPSADLPYADRLVTHLSTGLPGSQDRRSLLTVAALLHDIGKPATYSVGDDGAVHYFDHDRVGAGMAAALLERLRFSRPAIGWVTTVVRHHLRPLLLARAPAVTRRAVHRFFRDTGAAGVDVVLLSLADHPPATETAPGDQSGATQQAVAATLLEAWFVGYAEVIMPRPLLSGGDIVRRLGMTPGPLVGELQRDLQEAQAAGEVVTPEQAEAWVRSRLETR
jgi:putative nucleotidyltransferase with HDIG domain